jgi:hypothetical protein
LKKMRWQYRTIVFEFQKDGLLGDRFIDDEGVEKTLNEQGREGWELVSATMIQDGLLTLLKRPEEERETEGMQIGSAGVAMSSSRPETAEQEEEINIGRIQEQEREHIRSLQEQRARAVREEQKRLFGEIRIR